MAESIHTDVFDLNHISDLGKESTSARVVEQEGQKDVDEIKKIFVDRLRSYFYRVSTRYFEEFSSQISAVASRLATLEGGRRDIMENIAVETAILEEAVCERFGIKMPENPRQELPSQIRYIRGAAFETLVDIALMH